MCTLKGVTVERENYTRGSNQNKKIFRMMKKLNERKKRIVSKTTHGTMNMNKIEKRKEITTTKTKIKV